MLDFNRYLDSMIGIITTILSIVKSEFLIERMGIEKFGITIIVLVIVTIVMLSDSPKKDR